VRIGLAVLALAGIVAVIITPLKVGQAVCKAWSPTIGIRRDGELVVSQLLQATVELLPQGKNHYFERMTGMPLEFLWDGRGNVDRLILRMDGTPFTFRKTSEQPPEPFKPRAAVKLDPGLYEGYVGRYEFGPDEFFPDGLDLTIRRQGEQLCAEGSNTNGTLGAVEVYPVSETNFCLAIGVELIFDRNNQGEVTGATRRAPGWPDCKGKKLSGASKPQSF
jgi:hypothetical protein